MSQVFYYIIEQSAVTDKQLGYQEVIQPEPKAAAEPADEEGETDAK